MVCLAAVSDQLAWRLWGSALACATPLRSRRADGVMGSPGSLHVPLAVITVCGGGFVCYVCVCGGGACAAHDGGGRQGCASHACARPPTHFFVGLLKPRTCASKAGVTL